MDPLSTSTFPSQTMDAAIVSQAEAERLEAVGRYAILDTPAEGAFDRITRLAASIFDVPIAIVSIVDHDRIWLKSAHGLQGVPQLPREPGLCSSAIEGCEPLVIESALDDPVARVNSLVSGPFGLRFYVGAPLTTSDGFNLGTLCVVDAAPRSADPAKVSMLVELAQIVIDELELRLAARRLANESSRREDAERSEIASKHLLATDELTGLGNRRGFSRDLEARHIAFIGGASQTGGTIVIDIDGLKSVNDRRGHDVGDRLLRSFSAALLTAFAGKAIYRIGGDEFVVTDLLGDLSEAQIHAAVDEAVCSSQEDGFPEIGASHGYAAFSEVDGSPRGAMRLADSRMYAAKIGHRAPSR